MANLLDETSGPVNDNGRDIHVIDKQLPVQVGFGSTLFEISLWRTLPLLVILYVLIMGDNLEEPIGTCRRMSGRNLAGNHLHLHENLRS